MVSETTHNKGGLTHLHAESWRDTGREDHLLPVLRVWTGRRQPEGGTQGFRPRGKHLLFPVTSSTTAAGA